MNWGGLWSGLRTAGHAIFYAVMGMACAAFVVIGVIEIAGRDRPVHWGTFTETSTVCDPGSRRNCVITGRWVSDDGTITRDAVEFDGYVEPGHAVRASYQPGGPMGDDENGVVHTAFWSRAGLWTPWVAVVLSMAVIWDRRRGWRRDARRYRGRPPTQPT